MMMIIMMIIVKTIIKAFYIYTYVYIYYIYIYISICNNTIYTDSVGFDSFPNLFGFSKHGSLNPCSGQGSFLACFNVFSQATLLVSFTTTWP